MIRNFKQVPASQIGVDPVYQLGCEQLGLLYVLNEHHRAEPLGAQCGNCHTIVWITGRDDPILDEKYPEKLPPSGPAARQYYQDKLKRFLASLPSCPNCHIQQYDAFINNTSERFADGTKFVSSFDAQENIELSKLEKNRLVWWYGDEAEAKRLGL